MWTFSWNVYTRKLEQTQDYLRVMVVLTQYSLEFAWVNSSTRAQTKLQSVSLFALAAPDATPRFLSLSLSFSPSSWSQKQLTHSRVKSRTGLVLSSIASTNQKPSRSWTVHSHYLNNYVQGKRVSKGWLSNKRKGTLYTGVVPVQRHSLTPPLNCTSCVGYSPWAFVEKN